MTENNVNTQEVATEDEISAVEEVEIANEETVEAPKKRKFEIKFKNPKTQEKWEKVLAWLDAHETVMQAIKFTLISLVAFLSEFAILYILQYSLLDTCGQEDFKWWIFNYKGGRTEAFGLAGFIAMLGSKLVAEIISFTQNWKKNFKANSNRTFAVTVYVITVVAIIIFTQWLSGALASVIHNEAGLTICKMLGSVVSFVVIFLMDKFVIMRRKPEKEEGSAEHHEVGKIGPNGEIVVAPPTFSGLELYALLHEGVDIVNTDDKELRKWLNKKA